MNKPGTTQDITEKYKRAEFGTSWLNGFKARHNIRGNIRINGDRDSLPSNIDEVMALGYWYYSIRSSHKMVCSTEAFLGVLFPCKMTMELILKKIITVILSINGDGSYNSIVVIGKSKCPRNCNRKFWEENEIDYYSNRKA
jgi:hypothetical protein